MMLRPANRCAQPQADWQQLLDAVRSSPELWGRLVSCLAVAEARQAVCPARLPPRDPALALGHAILELAEMGSTHLYRDRG